jgi:predicted TIM-barrel fold metal-dependent hydrolase
MGRLARALIATAGLLMAGGTGLAADSAAQPIIDMHRHTPWPGESDAEGLVLIRQEMRDHHVVAAALFITDREDVAHYVADEHTRFVLSPMFPCPALTADRKWCFTERPALMPDKAWLEQQLAAGTLGGIGELVFNYAAVSPDDPSMAPFWALAAKYDVPAFVHTGRGPDEGQGPRRPGCCPDYQADYGNPAMLRTVLGRHPDLRVVLQHVGFDYLDETVALMRDFPSVYLDMSVLNSVGPRALHDASLRRLVEVGLADRILFGSDDQDITPIVERIEGAAFLTEQQRRGIYYDNAARFLRFDATTIAADYAR